MNTPEDIAIDCIGVDNLKHYCRPHEDTTLCGVKVKTKKAKDFEKYRCDLYSCYECTF